MKNSSPSFGLNGKDKCQENQKFTASDEAKSISEALNLSWPRNEKRSELRFIHESLQFAKKLDHAISKLASESFSDFMATTTIPGHQAGNAQLYTLKINCQEIKGKFPGYKELTKAWTKQVNETAWNWSGWRGRLMKWVLCWKTEWLHDFLANYTAEFRGDGGYYYDVIKPKLKFVLDKIER